MFRVRILLVAVLAASTLVVLAGPASARRLAEREVLCAVETHRRQAQRPADAGRQAKETFKQFKAAGKYAPAKVKKAANTIADVPVEDRERRRRPTCRTSPELYTSNNFRAYPKAITTFFLYSARCGA